MPESRTVRTMCPMNCHPTLCGMKVTVTGNQLESITGDDENPDSKGFLCLRGQAAHQIIDNPKRILTPRIRRQRTSNWESISWQDAFTEITTRLNRIKPEEFGIWLGHGDAATNYGTRLGGLLSRRFAHLYGCQWWHPAMICWGLPGFGFGLTGVLDVHTKEDMSANAELIILWGANIASQPNTAPHLTKAKKRGARIITIDIRRSEAAALADDYYPIKAGSDAALALAMMHVLITEQLVDQAFINKHTLGFEALVEHIQQYTPEWAASKTGIDSNTIKQLSRDYAATRQAMILVGGSSMHKQRQGWQAARAIACLPALTGKLGIPGAGLGPRHGASSSGQGLNTIAPDSGNSCKRIVPNQMSAMIEAMHNKKVKALLLSGTNMLSSFANSTELENALKEMDLVICHDLFDNDTIRNYADIVLPATAWLEQIGCKMTNTHLYFMEQALPAPGDTHTLSQLLQQLAQHFDVEDFFPWDNDEGFIDAVICHPSTSHATVAKLREEGGIRPLNIEHHAYTKHDYPTPSGKVEFYSQQALDFGLSALPCFENNEVDSYPLAFRQGRTLKHFHAFYDHGQALPGLSKHNKEPELWLSPEDAAARNIENKDWIRIHNQRGEMEARALVTDKIAKGIVWMRDGWQGINRLTNSAPCLPDAAVDLFAFSAGQSAFDAMVEISKAE